MRKTSSSTNLGHFDINCDVEIEIVWTFDSYLELLYFIKSRRKIEYFRFVYLLSKHFELNSGID